MDLVPYASFLAEILTIVDTTHYSYQELGNEISIETGGISATMDVGMGMSTMGNMMNGFTQMTKKRASLVCEPALAFCAREIDLGSFLLLGKGEEATGGRHRDSIVSDAMEATIGAIFLDGGFEPAKAFVLNYILNDIEHKQLFYDSKTILQELIQGETDEEIVYTILKEEGPDHDKSFWAQVSVGKKALGTGKGRTKKAAEQAAAYDAILARKKA